MATEYRTIEEVAGPLMLVKGVKNVNYDDILIYIEFQKMIIRLIKYILL